MAVSFSKDDWTGETAVVSPLKMDKDGEYNLKVAVMQHHGCQLPEKLNEEEERPLRSDVVTLFVTDVLSNIFRTTASARTSS